jgi:phosphinothricin acetyltransferase
MSDISLRPFAWRDIPAITAIYRPYVTDTVITFEYDPPSEATMAARFGAMVELGHPIIIAERGDEVVGYAYASYYRTRVAYRFTCENSIYLRQDMVGQGLGGRLLDRLIEESRAFGFRQMIAVITAERANSIRLHEKAGFVHVGTQENTGFKFDRWIGVTYMQKAL